MDGSTIKNSSPPPLPARPSPPRASPSPTLPLHARVAVASAVAGIAHRPRAPVDAPPRAPDDAVAAVTLVLISVDANMVVVAKCARGVDDARDILARAVVDPPTSHDPSVDPIDVRGDFDYALKFAKIIEF